MPDKPNQVFSTTDGSSSLISGRFGEAYHSRHGAIQESQHVFIDAGLKYAIAQELEQINILEIGFGTGLNAFMTYLEAKSISNTKINYHTIEAYPVTTEQYELLNYAEILEADQAEFVLMHESKWNETVQLHYNFSLTKYHQTFETFKSEIPFDLIYFDAFAPSIQAHLWDVPYLETIYKICKDDAALVTYCAKGSFKRALKTCGFKLESLPGPAKKREMTRALKTSKS